MKNFTRLLAGKSASIVWLSVALGALTPAYANIVASPEPADYALGFGAATLGFVLWGNHRRSRRR